MTTPDLPTRIQLVLCGQCGYSGAIDTYLPALSAQADCRCPKCHSTDNQHNQAYNDRIRKAWNCKHQGSLEEAGFSHHGNKPLLKCTECGSIGLADSMRNKP